MNDNQSLSSVASEPLARLSPGSLAASASQNPIMTIGWLERALLQQFPVCDAEAWDRTGLLVGDRSQAIERVAVALDPTVTAIKQAAAAGANVLVTHHPAFMTAPDEFTPAVSCACAKGAGVYEAIQQGVALMNFHTALDVSHAAQQVLPGLLHLRRCGVLEPLAHDKSKGYGQLCQLEEVNGVSLAVLGARCTAVFGRAPRMWGNPQRIIRSVITWTGSGGSAVPAALASGFDVLICGEIKYHEALEASEAGLSILELGHDVSELPLVSLLAAQVQAFGVSKERIILLDQSRNWAHPEAIRL